MRRFLWLAVVVALFAGCTDGDETGGENASPSVSVTSDATTSPAPEDIVPTTDTLYFRKAPDMNVYAGAESAPETTPYSFGSGFGGAPPRWEYRAEADATPTGIDATIWIRVVEPLVVPPEQPACVWSLQVHANDEPAFPTMCSGPNGPNIMPGDYELGFSSGSPNQTAIAARSTWAFVLGRTAFSPTPNEAVHVLTGSEDFASNAIIDGLAEPKPVR